MQAGREPIVVDIETAFPAGLIANELITNAIKHAFVERSQGTITIDVDRSASERVRRLVRQIGGVLAVESGPGARISITFPLARSPA
jgi:two-component sensor histidine kinase